MADDDRTAQEIGALFGAQMMGGTLGAGPAAPGTRLGRIEAADRQLAAREISEADHARVWQEIRREIREQIAAEGRGD